MAQFFALQDKVSLKIIAYVSDDSQGFAAINLANLNKLGPFATQAAAQQALEPQILSPDQVTLNNLSVKASATWTLADLADWLKAKH